MVWNFLQWVQIIFRRIVFIAISRKIPASGSCAPQSQPNIECALRRYWFPLIAPLCDFARSQWCRHCRGGWNFCFYHWKTTVMVGKWTMRLAQILVSADCTACIAMNFFMFLCLIILNITQCREKTNLNMVCPWTRNCMPVEISSYRNTIFCKCDFARSQWCRHCRGGWNFCF